MQSESDAEAERAYRAMERAALRDLAIRTITDPQASWARVRVAEARLVSASLDNEATASAFTADATAALLADVRAALQRYAERTREGANASEQT